MTEGHALLWELVNTVGRSFRTTETRIIEAAVAQADDRARREGQPMTVYQVSHDRYGRDAVFSVRSDTEGRPDPHAVTVYRTGVSP